MNESTVADAEGEEAESEYPLENDSLVSDGDVEEEAKAVGDSLEEAAAADIVGPNDKKAGDQQRKKIPKVIGTRNYTNSNHNIEPQHMNALLFCLGVFPIFVLSTEF